jgi:ABC-type transport system involved in cytochrome bd biosynthesis fused ATPase/permease subunit
MLLIILPIIDSITFQLVETIEIKMNKNTKQVFMKAHYTKYKQLSFLDKNQTTPDHVFKIALDAMTSLHMMLSWGFSTCFELINTFISVIMIICINKLYMIGLMLFIINTAFYMFVLGQRHINFSNKRKERRKALLKLSNRRNINSALFEAGQRSVQEMCNIENDIFNHDEITDIAWTRLCFWNKLPVNICYIFMVYTLWTNSYENTVFLVCLNMFTKFSSAITRFFMFGNNYNRFKGMWETYTQFWEDKTFVSDPIQLDINYPLVITNVYINYGTFNVKFHDSIKEFKINCNEQILIRGPSGHGKSTFVNALLGKISGITLTVNKPENYKHNFVEFFQNIKEKMKTSTSTVRELFHDENDDSLIHRTCTICCIDDWLDGIGLDEDIQEKISGGQKSRLCLAIQIALLIKQNRQIILLDEPEQGSDPHISYQIVENIRKEFPKKILIIISHLELIETKFNWTKILRFNTGIITMD